MLREESQPKFLITKLLGRGRKLRVHKTFRSPTRRLDNVLWIERGGMYYSLLIFNENIRKSLFYMFKRGTERKPWLILA